MLKFELIPDALEAKWIELSKAQSDWEYLDENKKNILASLMLKFEGSVASREMQARNHDEYKSHLFALKDAREEMLKLRAEISSLEISFEWYRSTNANERARINMR